MTSLETKFPEDAVWYYIDGAGVERIAENPVSALSSFDIYRKDTTEE